MSAKVTVQSDLRALLADLQAVAEKARSLQGSLKTSVEDVGSATEESTKRSLTFMQKLKGMGRDAAKTLKDDFKTLLSLGGVAGGLKLSQQFSGTVKETVTLSNTIRKLSSTFGIAGQDFARFQTKMTKGLGDIGMSSEVAARALEGLAETPVRGEDNLLGYSKTAGMLASVGREQGNEGNIARLMARTLQSRNVDPNNMAEMQKLAESVRRASNASGKGPSVVLDAMNSIFSEMSDDLRKKIKPESMAQIAAGAAAAGPNATAFLERYMKMSQTQRAGLDARGMGKAFGPNGINTGAIQSLYKQAQGLGGGDVRLGVKALGIEDDETAEGFIRLAQSLEAVDRAQQGVRNSSGNLEQQYRSSMGAGEAFRASINKIKGMGADLLSTVTQKGTDLLSQASESKAGAGLVVGGSAALAALLAGRGMKGLGGLLGGAAKSAAVEGITGEKVQKVEVINFPADFGGMGSAAGGLLGKGGGMAGMAMRIGAGGLAAGAGAAAGAYLSDKFDESTKGTELDKSLTEAVRNLATMLGFLPEIVQGTKGQKVEIQVKSTDPRFTAVKAPTRGGNN